MNTNGDPYRGPHIFLSVPEGDLVKRLIKDVTLNTQEGELRDSVVAKVRAAQGAHPLFHQPATDIKQPAQPMQ